MLSKSGREACTQLCLDCKGQAICLCVQLNYVWGAIGLNGRSQLVQIRGNMNNVRYRNDIIDPHVLPLVRGMRGQDTFQQDNAPPHRAQATIAHLQANNIRVMTPWPANSPDLNPTGQSC